MVLSKCVNKLLTRLGEEGKLTEEEARRIREQIKAKYERIDEKIKHFEQVLNLVDSTGIPPDAIVYFLRSGFSEEAIMRIGEIAKEYYITRSSIRFEAYQFIKKNVPIGDVPGLMEVKEMLRRGPSFRHDLIISAYRRLGGIEALRQYTRFILDNKDLIASALPGKLSDADTPKIEWFSAWLTYELSGRDPKKAKEALESYIDSLHMT